MAKTLLTFFCFAFTLCFGTTWALFPLLDGNAGHAGPFPAHQSFKRLARAPPFSMNDIAARHDEELKSTHRMARMIGTTKRAVAMCGKNSPDKAKCPLNVCCSGAGFCGTDDEYCSPDHPVTPCQKGYGSCKGGDKEDPGKGGNGGTPSNCTPNSANGRSIAYVQVDKINSGPCGVQISQLRMEGLTHLYLAFATIDPKTFAVSAPEAHTALYPQFTALRKSDKKPEIWIALGGWAFSDPGPTHTTWSDMASTKETRAQFITSLKAFLDMHKFDGVDIDWEYPAVEERGGRPADTKNFVLLVKEMKEAFSQGNKKYGISVAIPLSYWWLRKFDLKAMEPYVESFGLMSYDLHGPWDGKKKETKVVAGHTDLPEIAKLIEPLWFSGVPRSKVTLGLAFYGRGYNLAKADCKSIGCPWNMPTAPLTCSAGEGVMTLDEIEAKLTQLNGVKPMILEKAMIKELVWEGNWIGYDDHETIDLKKKWASGQCIGGTMVWSLDQYPNKGYK